MQCAPQFACKTCRKDGRYKVTRAQKGSALVFVVVLCAALLLLGTYLLDLNSVDLQIAVNQRDSLQAYYLAETGIESALAVLREYDPYYTGNSTTTLSEGNFNIIVSAQEQAFGGRRVTITSNAQAGRVQEQINLEFQSFPPFNGGTDGATLGWYDETDGIIVPGIHTSEDGVVLLGFADIVLPLKLQHQEENSDAHFAAAQLFFISSPIGLLIEEALEISTGTAVFQGSVVLSPPGGSLRFLHPSCTAVPVYFRDQVVTLEQHVLLEAGLYHFPHGYHLTGASNPAELGTFRVLPLVPGTMIRWGRG